MELCLGVECNQTYQHLLKDISDNILRYLARVLIYKISERSAVHVLDKHEERLLEIICEIICFDGGRTAHFHYCDFSLYFL